MRRSSSRSLVPAFDHLRHGAWAGTQRGRLTSVRRCSGRRVVSRPDRPASAGPESLPLRAQASAGTRHGCRSAWPVSPSPHASRLPQSSGRNRPGAGVAPGGETPARGRGHSPTQSNRVGRQLARRRLHNAGYERASGRQKKDCQEPGMYGALPSDRMRRHHTCHSF